MRLIFSFAFPALSHFVNIPLLLILNSFLTVNYSVFPLSKKHHFGFAGGPDRVTQFRHDALIPMYNPSNKEHQERLIIRSSVTFHEIIIGAPFEALNQETMEKPILCLGTKYWCQMRDFLTKRVSGFTKWVSCTCSYQTWSEVIP